MKANIQKKVEKRISYADLFVCSYYSTHMPDLSLP